MSLIAILMASVVVPALASDGARLYLQTRPLQDEKLLVVDVQVADVTDLYSAEVQLRYSPSQLQVEDAVAHLEGVQNAPGNLFPSDRRVVIKNEVDVQTGVINFAVTMTNPAPAISGDGTLVTLVFRIVGSGPFVVEFTRAELASSSYAAIPVTTENLTLGQDLQPAQPAARRTLPSWGWWGTAGLAALLVALLLVLRLRRVAAGRTVAARSWPRKIPTSSLPPSRLSATLTQQGHRALERGDLSLAYELFSRAVEQDPANAEAWLGKGLVAQQLTEKRICFQRVLALDPNNLTAQAELQHLAG